MSSLNPANPSRIAVLPNGRECLAVEQPDGRLRLIWIVSGGEDPPADPPAVDPPADPPATKIAWDQVDWDAGPKITDKNLPKPLQDVVNRIMARERREQEQKAGTITTQLQAEVEKRQTLEARLGDLDAALEALKNPAPADANDPLKPPANLAKHPDLAAAWIETRKALLAAEAEGTSSKALVADLKATIESMKAELTNETKARTAAQQKALDNRRDREVLAALTDLDAIDAKRILPLYRDNFIYDENTDSYGYRTPDGEVVDVGTGLAADLPAHFVKPSTTTGGSGATGGNGTVRSKAGTKPADPIADARAKLSQEKADIHARKEKAGRLSSTDQARLIAIGRETDALGPASA